MIISKIIRTVPVTWQPIFKQFSVTLNFARHLNASSNHPLVEIRSLDLHQKIYEERKKDTIIDKATLLILEENPLVPKVTLDLKYKCLRRSMSNPKKSEYGNLPSEVLFGQYNEKDDETIENNLYSVINKLDDTEVDAKYFFSSNMADEEDKLHVVALRLSQGLTKLRAPADVYIRARILVSGNKWKPFTIEEDKTILEHMSSTTSSVPFSELSRMLNR